MNNQDVFAYFMRPRNEFSRKEEILSNSSILRVIQPMLLVAGQNLARLSEVDMKSIQGSGNQLFAEGKGGSIHYFRGVEYSTNPRWQDLIYGKNYLDTNILFENTSMGSSLDFEVLFTFNNQLSREIWNLRDSRITPFVNDPTLGASY